MNSTDGPPSMASRTSASSLLPPLGLYVHFPWCVSKCPYCDFNSHALRDALPEARYVDALLADLEAEVVADPALAPAGARSPACSWAAARRACSRPRRSAACSRARAAACRSRPTSRSRWRPTPARSSAVASPDIAAPASIASRSGAQSFDAAALQRLGRIHSPDDTRRAAAELHAAGLAELQPRPDVRAARTVDVAARCTTSTARSRSSPRSCRTTT